MNVNTLIYAPSVKAIAERMNVPLFVASMNLRVIIASRHAKFAAVVGPITLCPAPHDALVSRLRSGSSMATAVFPWPIRAVDFLFASKENLFVVQDCELIVDKCMN